jgi:hypothetical protein
MDIPTYIARTLLFSRESVQAVPLPLFYISTIVGADALVILGYTLVFLVFKENPFASRVVEVV